MMGFEEGQRFEAAFTVEDPSSPQPPIIKSDPESALVILKKVCLTLIEATSGFLKPDEFSDSGCFHSDDGSFVDK